MFKRASLQQVSKALLMSLMAGFAVAAAAQVAPAQSNLVQVDNAWIRATVKGQKSTGGFMDLTSARSLSLVGFESTAAKHAQLHEMSMDGDVMRMRELSAVPLPAGTKVSLKPGALHLMLIDLKQPLQQGQSLDLILKLKGADGKQFSQSVTVPVKLAVPASAH